MLAKKKLLISLVALGLVAAVGTGTGLGLAGTFDSDDSSPAKVARPATTSTPPLASDNPTSGSLVAPDPNFQEELKRAGISTRGWETDFSRHSVPFNEIFSGGVPRDGIPPLDDPKFTTPEQADQWLGDAEPVISFEINGDARAYPLQILTWHEVVNDVVGGVPVVATFCPLCNSAIVFDRTLDGVVHDFGVSGKLRNSDLIMWDRQTESWWQQFTGEAIVGELTGTKLTLLPASIISWVDFKAANPEGQVRIWRGWAMPSRLSASRSTAMPGPTPSRF